MPGIDRTPIDGLIRHTEREPFGSRGHLGTTLYMNDRVDVYAAMDDDGRVTIHIGGGGGSSSMSFSAAQWDLIIAHVNAVRAEAAA
ncbi:hypothetical protein A5784_30830 [Mycobacterium sp. 852013-50091_SCH5140682]|uniref:hypothetical protein n=1 Tax=Mycobacterium sp. 852013-50091_SCH5140682 TaxID=1834109 RepID=UPI0007EB4FF9|nr:hypothetical protein [Mycobacterium sp. 852013-50091_SCH5140682]OBC14096.1 hypothetical protein A5784_30830 [Mycobacterium sp. 852013-50091_SCH5140682]